MVRLFVLSVYRLFHFWVGWALRAKRLFRVVGREKYVRYLRLCVSSVVSRCVVCGACVLFLLNGVGRLLAMKIVSVRAKIEQNRSKRMFLVLGGRVLA